MVSSICARIAWQKLGNMSQEEAMQKYVAVLTAIDPTWHQSHQKVPIKTVSIFGLLSSVHEFLWTYPVHDPSEVY